LPCFELYKKPGLTINTMNTNNQTPDAATNDGIPAGTPQKATDNQDNEKPKKRKKKHVSALVAASMGRSAVNQVGGNAYKDTDFMDTGTNLSYREEE